MDLFIFLIGILILGIGLILTIVNLIKRRPLKKYGITILAGVILMIGGLFMGDTDKEEPNREPEIEKIQNEDAKSKTEEKQDKEEKAKENSYEEDSAKENKEEKEENKEKEEKQYIEEKPEEILIQDNRLFNEMYYNIAARELPHGKDAVLMKAKANNFSIEENEEMNSLKISDSQNNEKYRDDYVYVVFDDTREGNTVTSASYYHEKENIEIGFANYSTDGHRQYDNLNTHIIGEANKKAKTIEQQIEFLNTAKGQ